MTKVDSPFNEDYENIIFSREALILGEGLPENSGKTAGNYRDISCYANQVVVNFEREYWSLSPGIKIPVVPQIFYMADQILGEKNEKTQFSDQNLTFTMVLFSQNVRANSTFTTVVFSQNIWENSKVLHMTKRPMLWTKSI